MARLVVSWNRRPKVTDNSDGFWRKIKLVPWRMKYPPKPELEDELKLELPGVFLWAVRGLGRLWSQHGFTKSTVIEEHSLLYRYENDPVKGFCTANLNLGGCVRKAELYQIFTEWASDRGQAVPSMESFCKEILRMYPGITTVRRREGDSRVAFFEGVSVASPN
jgi:putative DNA primase/helicase